MNDAQNPTVELTIAVFGNGSDVSLIRLDGSALPEVVKNGYRYCGCIGVANGAPSVQCEPGVFAALMMLRAGVALAGQLCERMKQ